MNHFLTRFRNRLALAFSSALLLIGLPAYLYIQHVYGEQLLADRGHALHRLAESAADLLAENLRERQREITLLARSPVLVAGQFERRDLAQFINTVQASYPQYAWIGLASPTGSVRAASGGLLLNADVAQRPWFKAGINGPFVGDLHEAVLLSKLLPPQKDGAPLRFLDFAAPVPGPDGPPLGVLAAHAY